MIAEQVTSATAEQDKLVEAENGPCVFVEHADGSRFGFKRLTREVFVLRNERTERGGSEAVDADERMLQERAVWPSRDAWNSYVAASVFELEYYTQVYHIAHGGKKVRVADSSEVAAQAPNANVARWLTNGEIVVGFRKPGRAEVKMFKAHLLEQAEGRKQKDNPVETILRNCAQGPEFAAWLEDNLFGIARFSDAFLEAFGMQEARVTGN